MVHCMICVSGQPGSRKITSEARDDLSLISNDAPSMPSVGHPGFPARILPGFLRTPGRNIQESYQDLDRSSRKSRRQKCKKSKFFHSGSKQRSPVPSPNNLSLCYICLYMRNSILTNFQRRSSNCYWYRTRSAVALIISIKAAGKE